MLADGWVDLGLKLDLVEVVRRHVEDVVKFAHVLVDGQLNPHFKLLYDSNFKKYLGLFFS